MKTEIFRVALPAIMAMAVLSGCVTSALTKQDMTARPQQTLGEFIKERFYEHRPAWARALEEDFTIRPGDTLNYIAYYVYTGFESWFGSDVGEDIERPKRDLQAFCEAGGGQFSQLFSLRTNVAEAALLNGPRTAQILLDELRSQSAGHWAAPYREEVVRGLQSTMALYAFLWRSDVAQDYLRRAVKGYEISMHNDPLGAFVCVKDGLTEWDVTVIPVGFKPKDPGNSLSTPHAVTLAITARW